MRLVEEQWGTRIIMEVPDDTPESVPDELRRWFVRVDEMFSTWRDDSEIMRITAGTLGLDDASAEVREVLAMCEELRGRTNGGFDISVGGRPDAPPAPGRAPVDPSGYVKGWAIDRAGDLLATAGVDAFWLSAGGDVLVRSARVDAAPWRIGIQHPWRADAVAAVVELADGAVATSGRYERGDHVLDPRTGRPASGLMSVTVIGSELGEVDAYATATVALGSDGMEWIATVAGVEAMGITDDGGVIATLGFPTEGVVAGGSGDVARPAG